ncbi:hypothetical protein B1F84_12025 [Pseudoalteromonas sp. DL-6]|nr:hypothetical protein B1F84_12025 [Pseudoalteromonas sp. DL-6]
MFKPLPKDLFRGQVIHDIEDKTCNCCGGELHKMVEYKSEKLEFIPAQIKVIEHIRPKYACRHCDKLSTNMKHIQDKLVWVTSDEVFDVALDILQDSATYGQWVGEYLSADNKRQIWITAGFAHGFYVLSDSADFLYKCTD